MKKSSLPVSFKTLVKYKEEGSLCFDSSIQRSANQWSRIQKSMLIHSILGDYIIPSIYLTKESVNGENRLSVLDGKQRLTTVISFVNGEFVLSNKTPDVVVDDVKYEIASKSFSELDADLQSTIMQYRFGTYQLEDCSDEEIEETFSRLNAGTSLSKIQTARPKMGVDLSAFFNQLVAHDFFQVSLNLSLAQMRREDDLLMLITAVMLFENFRYGGFEIKTSASAAECVRFAEYIKNNYSEEKKNDIVSLVEYLDEAFGDEQYKFLRKNNIPVVMYVGLICMEHGISAEDFNDAIVAFFENVPDDYNINSGSGNVKMVKLRKRLSVLLDYIMSEFSESFDAEEKMLLEDNGEVQEDLNEAEDNDITT